MPKRKKAGTSGMPKSVKKQGDKAEELQKKLAQGAEINLDATEDPEDPNATNGGGEPTVKDPLKPRVEPGSDLDAGPALNSPQNLPAPNDSNADQIANLQHKLGTLEGKYNSEINRLSTIVEAQASLIEEQAGKIESFESAPAITNIDSPGSKKLDTDEFKGYGDEMVELAQLVNTLIDQNDSLRSRLAAAGSGSNDEIKDIKSKVEALGKTAVESKRDSYYRDLDRSVPDWEEINVSAGFAKWVDEVEPIVGVPRRAILSKANENMDSARVIAIFNAYKSSTAGPAVVESPAEEDPLAQEAIPDNAAPAPPAGHGNAVSVDDLTKAQKDLIAKRITEDQFNKIYNQFQKQLSAKPPR